MSRHHADEEKEDQEIEAELELETPYPLRIFEGSLTDCDPEKFDAIELTLDASLQASMDWREPLSIAEKATKSQLRLMWHFDFGVPQRLLYPLWHEGQLRSLTLALQQFKESVWPQFKAHSIGATLFKGSLDFSSYFDASEPVESGFSAWMREMNQTKLLLEPFLERQEEERECVLLYCRDLFLEFFSLLSAHLPLSLPRYLFFDVAGLASTLRSEMQLLNLERFEGWRLGLRGELLPFKACGWEKKGALGYSAKRSIELPVLQAESIGVCVPLTAFCFKRNCIGLEEALEYLLETKTPFKLISEAHLTANWEGLDYLLYSPSALTAQGKRKLQGFSAAGGVAVSTDHLLGFPGEISLREWISTT